MSKEKEIQKLVSKIVKARKIQKQVMEGEMSAEALRSESISKFQKPLVKEIADQAQNTIQALQHQQVQLAQIENAMRAPAAIAQAQASPTPEKDKSDKTSNAFDPKWVQNFYRKHMKSKLTRLEVDLQGNLGNSGFLDIQDLFNYGTIRMILNSKEQTIKPELITPGLIGLLMLPYDDLKEANVSMSMKDIHTYRDIMSKAGAKGSKTNRKYQKFLRGTEEDQERYEKERGSVMEQNRNEYYEKLEDEEIRKSMELTPKRLGKGFCKPYKTVNDLEERLELLLGSLSVGNTSSDVRNEARHTLDKLLEIKAILPTIHQKLFAKFKL